MLSISRRGTVAYCIAAISLLCLVPASRAQEKLYRPDLSEKFIETSLRTDWYGVYLKGGPAGKERKIGYFRSERKRVDGRIVDDNVMSMKLVSMGQKIEIEQHQVMTFASTAPYRLMAATLVEKSGVNEKKTTFAWNDAAKGYDTVHEVLGQKRAELLKNIDYTLADNDAVDVWVLQHPKVGDVMASSVFELSELKMDIQNSTIRSDKESVVGGVPVRFYDVETISKNTGIKLVSRHDDKGQTLSNTIAIFEMRRESEKEAKDTNFSHDVFVLGMAKIDRAVGSMRKVKELVLEMDAGNGEVFDNGARQTVTKTDKGTYLLKVGKQYGKLQKATPDEIKEGLAETNSYPITHPKVKALAEQATAGATTNDEKVAKIVAFVHKFVKPHLSGELPNIHDLMERKQGDCKSYALLVNNLARASGIPAREVSGLLYMGDDTKAFGGHAWNEVVLNGAWVPVDATFGETEVNATHLCLGVETRALKNLMESLGKLSFKLVEVKTAQ
jgi:hypothetical protein